MTTTVPIIVFIFIFDGRGQVFRPREKERYKLRKHRKNDLDSFRKLQQVKKDFEKVSSAPLRVKKKNRRRHRRFLLSLLLVLRSSALLL